MVKHGVKKFAALVIAAAMAMCSMASVAFAQEYKSTGTALTASWNANDKKLSLKAEGNLFAESEIVPGDVITTKAGISNTTGSDIKVRLVRVEDALKDKTNPDLYNYLTVKATQGSANLYDGAMSNAQQLQNTQVSIPNGGKAEMNVAVTLPATVGNEAQGGVLDTNWVFEVTMENAPSSGTNNKPSETPQPKQTVVITVPSKVNSSIQSGVDDIYHSSTVKVVLAGFVVVFMLAGGVYLKSKRSEKKEGKRKDA
jgi:hypothetical protein